MDGDCEKLSDFVAKQRKSMRKSAYGPHFRVIMKNRGIIPDKISK